MTKISVDINKYCYIEHKEKVIKILYYIILYYIILYFCLDKSLTYKGKLFQRRPY